MDHFRALEQHPFTRYAQKVYIPELRFNAVGQNCTLREPYAGDNPGHVWDAWRRHLKRTASEGLSLKRREVVLKAARALHEEADLRRDESREAKAVGDMCEDLWCACPGIPSVPMIASTATKKAFLVCVLPRVGSCAYAGAWTSLFGWQWRGKKMPALSASANEVAQRCHRTISEMGEDLVGEVLRCPPPGPGYYCQSAREYDAVSAAQTMRPSLDTAFRGAFPRKRETFWRCLRELLASARRTGDESLFLAAEVCSKAVVAAQKEFRDAFALMSCLFVLQETLVNFLSARWTGRTYICMAHVLSVVRMHAIFLLERVWRKCDRGACGTFAENVVSAPCSRTGNTEQAVWQRGRPFPRASSLAEGEAFFPSKQFGRGDRSFKVVMLQIVDAKLRPVCARALEAVRLGFENTVVNCDVIVRPCPRAPKATLGSAPCAQTHEGGAQEGDGSARTHEGGAQEEEGSARTHEGGAQEGDGGGRTRRVCPNYFPHAGLWAKFFAAWVECPKGLESHLRTVHWDRIQVPVFGLARDEQALFRGVYSNGDSMLLSFGDVWRATYSDAMNLTLNDMKTVATRVVANAAMEEMSSGHASEGGTQEQNTSEGVPRQATSGVAPTVLSVGTDPSSLTVIANPLCDVTSLVAKLNSVDIHSALLAAATPQSQASHSNFPCSSS